MITDTHTHLYLPEFEAPEIAVARAIEAGVGRMVFPNVDLTTIEPMKCLHARFPDETSMAMGLHPTEINAGWQEDLNIIERELDSDAPYIAVGEIGIDLYWDKKFRSEQMAAFDRQCRMAVNRNLPIIIHCREGLGEVLEVFRSLREIPRGVFHSFGGTAEDVAEIRKYGDFYFGINGIVTFKNSRLRDVLPTIGIDRILLETDSPYLAPVPHRGKRNESAYIIHTAAYVADVFGVSVDEVASLTTQNASNLFSQSLKI